MTPIDPPEDQDKAFDQARNRAGLLPEFPDIVEIHALGTRPAPDAPGGFVALLCCHDAANETAHQVEYPVGLMDTTIGELSDVAASHILLVLNAQFN